MFLDIFKGLRLAFLLNLVTNGEKYVVRNNIKQLNIAKFTNIVFSESFVLSAIKIELKVKQLKFSRD